jgi:hypothetical protein
MITLNFCPSGFRCLCLILNAPNANSNGDTLYAWVEWTVTF